MRYIVGIDLGTSNSSLSYVDLSDENFRNLPIKTFLIPQLGVHGIEESTSLPSYCYLLPKDHPIVPKLPWGGPKDHIVGKYALEEGSLVPTRFVQSAKSWLCHAHAARKMEILPVEPCESSGRISPVLATSRFLNHLREAWNYAMAKKDPEKNLEEQEIILTIPASFDEVARSLTLEAAKLAGFQKLTFLEEPQAAFYHWMACGEGKKEKALKNDALILIVDIGGGTSDFSLIEAKNGGFERIAVGDHLLLGGDNMDEALAYWIESKVNKSFPWATLRAWGRQIKEILLADNAPSSTQITLQGKGSHVVQATSSLKVYREEIVQMLLQGFFGQYSFEEAANLKKRSGFRKTELPYEEDPSITKHLAAFLKKTARRPNYILFNGGALKPKLFREAILSALKLWFKDDTIAELKTQSLDLAVAKGAAQFGKAKQGLAERIGGGVSRSYYVEIDHKGVKKAFTLLSRGTEEGTESKFDRIFELLPNAPVSFRVYTSHTRINDKIGDLIDIDLLELNPLPILQTVLRFGKTKESIPAHLSAKVSEIGILELALKSVKTDHLWVLEFQLGNNHPQAENFKCNEEFGLSELKEALEYIEGFFAEGHSHTNFMEHLEKILEKDRKDWSLSTLRIFAEKTVQLASKRKTSSNLLLKFWNFIGFCLRPGFGHPLDDFRNKELWKIILEDLGNKEKDEIKLQKWICYRRIAGGLNRGRQAMLSKNLLEDLNIEKTFKNRHDLYLQAELLRTLSALEWLEIPFKISLGKKVLQRILSGNTLSSDYSVLGRLATRRPLYASFTHLIPVDTVEEWLSQLLSSKLEANSLATLLAQIAAPGSSRECNISKKMIENILARFSSDEQQRLKEILLNEAAFTVKEQETFFSDSLPIGLKIGD